MSIKRRALLVLLAASVFSVWLVRHRIAVELGQYLVAEDPLEVADAIVVLGGDASVRAPHGAQLYRRSLAPVILAVGGTTADGNRSQANKTERVLRGMGVPQSSVLVAGLYEAGTLQEAHATADHATDRGWSSVIIVTSPYHTRRAGEIFRAVLYPLGVSVSVSSAPNDPYQVDGWWTDQRQSRQVRSEYIKYALWRLAGR